MAKKETKTNAMRILDQAGVSYEIHTYDVSDDLIDGVSVARKCNEDPEQVFKTLVTVGNDKEHYVFVIPVAEKLDLKECAKAVGVKSVEMIPQKDLLKLTGYIHGGCSPIGMKKFFKTVIDISAEDYDTIIFSAGKIGYQVEMSLSELSKVIRFTTADII